MSAAPPTSGLFIERLHNRYLVPADDAVSAELRDRCESSIRIELHSALAQVLDRSFDPQDSSVWFVRKLSLDFALSSQIDQGVAPRVWAQQIGSRLIEALRQPDDNEVIRFPDRAAYLAHFLLDLAGGSAWEKWYYTPFAGLRALSVTAALRTAILDQPETGLSAFDLLGDKASRIAEALCPPDAASVLAGLGDGPSNAEQSACVSAVARASSDAPYCPPKHEQRHALILFLATRRQVAGLGGRPLAEASRAVARLLRCQHEGSLSAGLSGGDLAALYQAVGPEHAPTLAPVLTSDAIRNLLSRSSPRLAETAFTHFGGMFLLLSLLDERPIGEATVDWPDPTENSGGTGAAALVRFLILVKCLGSRHAAGCFYDPLVRDWMRISPAVEPRSLAAWSGRIRPRHLNRLLEVLLSWHVKIGAVAGPPLELVKARCKGSPVIFEMDRERGIWVRRGGVHPATASLPDSATRDLAYLSLPRALGVRRGVDLTLSIAAQGLLRCFAWKLPGFSRSSLPYLASNFLSCTAGVEQTTDRAIVCLGRPPLHVILGMTGLNRTTYSLSWTGCPCAVFPEG